MAALTRIVLVQCPQWGFVPPLALAQLAGSLKDAGLPVGAVDLNIKLYHERGEGYRHAFSWEQSNLWRDELADRFLEEHREVVARLLIDPLPMTGSVLVGFSVNQCSIRTSLLAARWVKEARPEAFIAFGGQWYADPENTETTLESGVVDAVVCGDGEQTLIDLARTLGDGGRPEDCAGLHLWRGGNVVATPERAPADMDALSFLDYSVLDLDDYKVPDNLYQDALMIMASRGCVRRCTFCGSRYPWEGFRSMSGRRIYDEIKHQLSLRGGYNILKFYDIVTNGNIRHISELCDLLIADPSVKLEWRETNCIVRPEMTPTLLAKLRKAGCAHVNYGIETGSNRVLKLMRKGQTAELAERVLRDTHEAGIEITANFLFGYPGETEEDFEETLAFVGRVHPYIDIFYPSRTFITMEPYSDMARHKDELGVDDGVDVFWALKDRSNTYPIRLARYEKFSRLLKELGAFESPGVNSSLELNHWHSLGRYHEYEKEFDKAAGCYRKYLALDPGSQDIRCRLEACENAGIPAR
ncbi:MAG: radical SAM protein [Elusimicrobia bacterium]|nr:radical SAM protein [Elusimicrobiota bacterium]